MTRVVRRRIMEQPPRWECHAARCASGLAPRFAGLLFLLLLPRVALNAATKVLYSESACVISRTLPHCFRGNVLRTSAHAWSMVAALRTSFAKTSLACDFGTGGAFGRFCFIRPPNGVLLRGVICLISAGRSGGPAHATWTGFGCSGSCHEIPSTHARWRPPTLPCDDATRRRAHQPPS